MKSTVLNRENNIAAPSLGQRVVESTLFIPLLVCVRSNNAVCITGTYQWMDRLKAEASLFPLS